MYDRLPHTTSKIVAQKANGSLSSGTGFFFEVVVPEQGKAIILVTNKHVLRNAVSAQYYISFGKMQKPSDYITVTVENVSNFYVEHPDPNIDIAAISIGDALHELNKNGLEPFLATFDASLVPGHKEIENFTTIENILMIGYPTGIWDEFNNLPIIRKGITATPFAKNYNNRPEFLIDCACFPGSSGSPILIADQGSFPGKNGEIHIGQRIFLLGLLWGGPQFNAEGILVPVPVPTAVSEIAISRIPTNLGFCIKSEKILDLIPEISKKFPA